MIARRFGNEHRTTVTRSIAKIGEQRRGDKDLRTLNKLQDVVNG